MALVDEMAIKATGRYDMMQDPDGGYAEDREWRPARDPKDMVKHPKHYEVLTGVEAKHIIEATLIALYGENAYKAYCHGNMLKYLTRKKGNVSEDVAKAGRYSEMYSGEDR